jgi:hypothetical protein
MEPNPNLQNVNGPFLSDEAREQLLAGTVHGAGRRRWASARGYKEIHDRDKRNAAEQFAMHTPSNTGRTLDSGFLLFWDELKDVYHIRGTRQMACSGNMLLTYTRDIPENIQQRLLRFIQHVYGAELFQVVFKRDLGRGAYIVQEVYKDITYTITRETIENWAQLDGYEPIDNLDLLQAARRYLRLADFKGITTKLWANPAVDDYILQEDHLLHKVTGLQLMETGYHRLHPRYEELKQYSPSEHMWQGAAKIPHPQKDAVCTEVNKHAADVIINPADAEIWLTSDKETYIVRSPGLPDLTVMLPKQTALARAYDMSNEKVKKMMDSIPKLPEPGDQHYSVNGMELENSCGTMSDKFVVASTPMAEGHGWVKKQLEKGNGCGIDLTQERNKELAWKEIGELKAPRFLTAEELMRVVPQNAAHEQALMENGMIIHEDVLTGEKYAEPGPGFPRKDTLHTIEGRNTFNIRAAGWDLDFEGHKMCYINGIPCEMRMEGDQLYINGMKVE